MTIDKSVESETFEDYKKTLRLVCEDGEPSIMKWTVPEDAPDELYYQVSKNKSFPVALKIHYFSSFLSFRLIFPLLVLYTQKPWMEDYH